jgi:hypothetical protein
VGPLQQPASRLAGQFDKTQVLVEGCGLRRFGIDDEMLAALSV